MDSITNDYWQILKSNFMDYLKSGNLNPRYLKDYSRSMDLLIEYAAVNEFPEYSPETGFAFVESEKNRDYKGCTTLDRRRKTIRRLNEHLYGNTFWQKAPRNVTTYQTRHKPLQCPEPFASQFEEFLGSLKNIGLKEITIDQYRSLGTKMLCDFAEQGVENWSDISARNVTSAFSRSTNKKYFVHYAKRMFNYLVNHGIVTNDYSGILPMLNKRKTVPSVYSPDEVKQLLNSVERFTPQGKRDYAILLVAVRLGLRSSDIRLLRFKNVDFENSTVKFVQLKTSVANQLPLPQEVADGLHDYIDNGREESDEPYIFLDGNSRPLHRHAVSSIATRHFKQSGIDLGHRKHSAHSLRMSFASHLIAEKVPYEVVRTALGHVSRDSTRHYVEFDIESLRTCALEIPAPSGLFKKYLTGGGEK